ncbi:MAG: TIGR00282 family metallophosphoesterase, partial [Planctomycetota bacterium]
RDILKKQLPVLRQAENIHFCVANAENAAGGSGITPAIMDELLSYGIDVLTSGDHIWKKRDIIPVIEQSPRLLRPANYPREAAGKGFGLFTLDSGLTVGVINLQGRVFIPASDCPFKAAQLAVAELSKQTKIIIVDIHAEATSEKIAMGWYLDGQVSLIFGTHTHIQTADEQILPKETAYITDVGMTGPYESVLGRKIDRVLSSFLTQMPNEFEVAENDVRIGGVIAAVNSETGRALSIKRIMVK